MPPIESLVWKGFCSHGVVKTDFSEVVLDEIRETNERKSPTWASWYTLVCLLCLHVWANSFFSVCHWRCTRKSLESIESVVDITVIVHFIGYSLLTNLVFTMFKP